MYARMYVHTHTHTHTHIQIRERFDSGQDVELTNHNPHDVACLLKEFFRSLPEPLLTRELYQPFLATRSRLKRLYGAHKLNNYWLNSSESISRACRVPLTDKSIPRLIHLRQNSPTIYVTAQLRHNPCIAQTCWVLFFIWVKSKQVVQSM